MSEAPALDKAFQEVLPSGSKVLSVKSTGSSRWATTSIVSVALPCGTTQRYFLKTAASDTGRTILEGEFTATSAIYKAMPSFIPKPHNWGKLQGSETEMYFFLSDFIAISPTLPSPDKFTACLASLHRNATSPNGLFGFPIPTCDGALPHRVAWKANWGEFYSELLRGVIEHDAAANGRWIELDLIVDRTITHVIPRVLGVLQEGGRQVRPALIHGDMYEGNLGTNLDTMEIVIWDASSFYAHNEMELGLWRWNGIMKGFIDSYLKHYEKSEPKDEWDDRNRLYSIKSKINMSADHPGEDGQKWRQVALEDLKYLCGKYAPL